VFTEELFVTVKYCVVTEPPLPAGGLLVSPPPRFGQFSKQIALGGFSTLTATVPLAQSNVPGIVAFSCVEEILLTLIAVSSPYVESPVTVTDEPPFCDTGINPAPFNVN
jgi:hypothetical protein